jgi:hypothetical protein
MDDDDDHRRSLSKHGRITSLLLPTVVIPSEARDLLSASTPENTGVAALYGADVA